MPEKIIVHISREHGSLGHLVAEDLAKELDCQYYDDKLLEDIAKEHGLDKDFLKAYEEQPRRSLLYKLAQGTSVNLEEELTKQVFARIRKIEAENDRAVIVGRGAGTVLGDKEHVINVFISAEPETRVKNLAELTGRTEEDARKRIADIDKSRKRFHDTYSDTKWKDLDHYDLVIDTTKIGVAGAVKLILAYIDQLDEA